MEGKSEQSQLTQMEFTLHHSLASKSEIMALTSSLEARIKAIETSAGASVSANKGIGENGGGGGGGLVGADWRARMEAAVDHHAREAAAALDAVHRALVDSERRTQHAVNATREEVGRAVERHGWSAVALPLRLLLLKYPVVMAIGRSQNLATTTRMPSACVDHLP